MALSRTSALALVLFFSFGCDSGQKKATPDAPSGSASADQNAHLEDGRLGAALNKASSATAGSATLNQPPPNGIFAPGVADKLFPASAAPKLELFDEGIEPRVKLHASGFDQVQKMSMNLRIQLQDKDLLPPLVFNVEIAPPGVTVITTDKPEGKDGKDKKAGAKGAAPAASAATSAAASAGPAVPPPAELPAGADRPLVATVTGVSVAGMDAKNVPPQFQELIDVMRGATISFTLTKTGPAAFTRKFAKQADQEILQLLDLEFGTMEDTLSGMYTAAPDKPVGENGYWMVTDRRSSFGSDVIRYRVFKVVKVEGDHPIIEITQKQYAAEEKSTLIASSDMPDAVMGTYQANGKGLIEIAPRNYWPRNARLQMAIGAAVLPSQAKGNPNMKGVPVNFEIDVALGPEGAMDEAAAEDKEDKPAKPKKDAPNKPGK